MRAVKRFTPTCQSLSRCNFSSAQPAPQTQSAAPIRSSIMTILGEDTDELEAEDAFDRGGTHFGNGPQDFNGVIGHSSVMDKADFANARIGDVLEIPYEVTAGEFWRVCASIFSAV